LIKYVKGEEEFNAFDYILMLIWNISVNPLRACGYAHQVMCMIEKAMRGHSSIMWRTRPSVLKSLLLLLLFLLLLRQLAPHAQLPPAALGPPRAALGFLR
jgi:hypothetical protein